MARKAKTTEPVPVTVPDHTLTISSGALKSAVSIAKAFVPSRPSHPILSCFLLKLGDNTITAFDLSNSLELELKGIYNGPTTSLCVNAQLFSDAVSCLDGEIMLTVEESTILLKAGKTKYKLSYQAAEEYPALPDIESAPCEIPASLMSDIVRLTEFAATDQTKQVLTGVKAVMGNGLAEVAVTDGHRLHWFSQKVESTLPIIDAVIPATSLRLLNKLIADDVYIHVAVDEAQMKAIGNGWSFTARLLEGQFPNYKQLIPAQFAIECEVDKADLIAALQACRVVDFKGIFSAHCSEDGMRVFRNAADVGDFDQTIDATLKGNSIEFGGNGDYFIAALKLLDSERATLYFNTPITPIVIKAQGCKFEGLVMPCQTRQ